MSPDWRIVEREQSDLIVERCRLLGEGWNSNVYLVNEELVFSFPKRQAVWTELQREIV